SWLGVTSVTHSQECPTPPEPRKRGTRNVHLRTRPSPFSSPSWTISMRTSPCSMTRRSPLGRFRGRGCNAAHTSSGVPSISKAYVWVRMLLVTEHDGTRDGNSTLDVELVFV